MSDKQGGGVTDPRTIDIGDMSAMEALWFAFPATAWMLMLSDAMRRETPGRRCYWGNGFEVHVQPGCRCKRRGLPL